MPALFTMQAAEVIDRGLDPAMHAGFARDIELAEGRAFAHLPFLRAGVPGIRIQVADHHAAASAQHGLRNAAPDTLRTAGHQHDAITQWLGIVGGDGRSFAHGDSTYVVNIKRA
jgi:hypothetical protein